MAGQHSLLPPSSAARRVQCNASLMMEALHPETEESDDAKEGTASHELAAMMVRSYARAGLEWPGNAVGRAASNGVIWSEESFEGALMYADHVREIMTRTGVFGGPGLCIEQRVNIPRIHSESWGTPDLTLFDPSAGVLYVVDYKFGHRVVDVVENWQLIEYAIGRLDEITGGNGLQDQHIRIVMTVVQPRAYHRKGPIRSWEVWGSDLRPYANTLEATEAAALGPNPTTRTGPECLDCSARHACETLQQAAMGAIAYVGKPTPALLPPMAMGLEKRLLEQAATLIKARLTGLDAQIEATIRSGQVVPGWGLEPGQTRQRWTVPADEVFTLGDMVGVNLRKPAEPVTPKQAIKAGIDETVINAYSETPSGAMKLVEQSSAATAAIFRSRSLDQ